MVQQDHRSPTGPTGASRLLVAGFVLLFLASVAHATDTTVREASLPVGLLAAVLVVAAVVGRPHGR